MKKFLILILFLAPIVLNAQRYKPEVKRNLATAWYSIDQYYMLEYSRHLAHRSDQLYGINLGVGHNFDDSSKISLGMQGIQITRSGWNPLYKMGLVLYDFENYDVFAGIGIEKNRMHVAAKVNLIHITSEGWLEFGIGLSF